MPRLIALDIGTHAVKLCVLRVAAKHDVELEASAQVPVPQDGSPPTHEQRFAALDALFEQEPELKPSGSDVLVASFPSEDASFRRIRMPFVDRDKIEQTLPFRIEGEVPFDLSEMVFGWRTIEADGGAEVAIVLSRTEQVGQWLALLQERGLDPAALHVAYELYGDWDSADPDVLPDEDGVAEALAPKELEAVIDVGHRSTSIAVRSGGRVWAARALSHGGADFTRVIQQTMGCSWAEAEAFKHQAGQEGGPSEPARKAMAEVAKRWTAEIRATLIATEDALGGAIERVRLTGGGSRLTGIAPMLEKQLGVPVEPVASVIDAALTGPNGLLSAMCAAAVPGSNADPIDLRVGPLQYRGGTDWIRTIVGYGVFGAAAVAVAALAFFGVQYRTLSVEQADAMDAVVAVIVRSVPGVTEDQVTSLEMAEGLMFDATADAQERADVLGGGSGGVPPMVGLLHELTEAFPPHADVPVELSDLTMTLESIQFSAETDGYASSASVENMLQGHARFGQATKGQETRLSNGRVRFPITIPLGDPLETEER